MTGSAIRHPADDNHSSCLQGRLHAVDNVYIAGAAVFPTEGSWNPTLTMVAMGHRLARHLTRR